MLFTLLALQAAQNEILVTASRTPVAREEIGVSSTILDAQRIDALGAVQTIDLLRLVPGVSVSVSGSRGTTAQVRIRGAEANHSLLFIDGIEFNDPAAGNEGRFENLSADNLSQLEVVRGPQSALWGSEALGGVIALSTPLVDQTSFSALGEAGSRGSLRGAATVGLGFESGAITFTGSHFETDGIDVLGGGAGDRDGYRNTTIGFRGVVRPAPGGEIGIAARYIDARSEFDGTDPVTFLRADTAENSSTETAAVRVHAALGADRVGPWTFTIAGEYLDSSNRNRDGSTPLNRTSGDRFRTSAQLERRLALAGMSHLLIAAVDREDEGFTARDQQYLGSTDQDRTRGRTAFVGEWRAQWSDLLSTDVAVRHDDFNRFKDETTVRAAVIANLGAGFSLSAAYGEGIAQPTFFDLYGFFPGSFVGNPDLRPERSRGYEIGARYEADRFSIAVAAFDNQLEDEIISTFDGVTFLSSTANATGESKRRGIEVSGATSPIEGFRIGASYTYLDAEDQQVAGGAQLREVRRPKHSASALADYERGPLMVGASLAYVGERRDTDFDIFQDVTLKDYVLASLRIGYRVTDAVEAFGRVDNAFDAEYQDVVGYETPGRSVHAGLRVRLGR
jgi:vitamin B12 transporter